MANIGVARASIYADLSATKFEKEAIKAVERVAKTGTKSSSGDQVKFSAMEDTFRLDIAAKNGAIRSMTAAQGYLLATMNALDSGDYILKELHDLAVQASDGNKTANELSALDVGAEILGDEFHKLMTSANFKGKPVFSETNTSMKIGTGVQNTSMDIGIKQVEYDDLYDHINAPENSITPGITYEITKPLTNDQKETILARSSASNAAQLVVGAQFTVIDQAANPNSEGIHTKDLYYVDGDGSVPFDATAKVSRDRVNGKGFGGGYLDIEITQNAESSDSFTLVPGNGAAGTITVNSNAVSYVDPVVGSIEIGTIDGTRNGQYHQTDNANTALRINFHADTTIPGTSNIANGDFSTTMAEVLSYTEQFRTQNRTEVRNGFISTLNDKDGNAITMGAIADANRTYENVTLAYKPGQPGTAGEGTVRAHIKTAIDGGGNETITHMEIIDGGKNFANNEILLIPAGNGNIAGQEITITGVLNGHTHTLTAARTRNIIGNATWPDGTAPGQYNFDATGAPAVGGNNLTYVAGDVKKRQVVNVVQVNDTWPDGTAPGQYNFDASGAPAVGGNNLTYVAGDVKKRQVVTTTRVGENDVTSYSIANVTVNQNQYSIANVTEVTGTTYLGERNLRETVSTGFTPNHKTVATNWTRYMGRVDFGSNFTISEFANQTKDILNPGNGTVDTAPRVEYSVPTPTEAQMAQPSYADANGNVASNAVKGNDNTAVGSVISNPDITIQNGELKLNTGEFNFSQGFGIYHGPAAVSDVFYADEGDFLKLDYEAQGVYDDYHVAGYIYEVNPDGSAKTAPIMALNETGKTVNSRASVEVPKNGNYRFVFIVGTHDKTGGLQAGADMLIDNIVAEEPYKITDSIVEKIMTSTNYSSSSNDQKYVKDVKVISNYVDDHDEDTSKIFNTEYENRIMIAPTLNLEKPVSFGASNNLGPGGTTDPYVVVSKIEEVQTRIGSAKAAARAHYAVLESAIDSSTDMRDQFFWGADAISDPEFFADTAYFTKQQIMQDHASAILAQANKSQSGLMKLVDTQILSEA